MPVDSTTMPALDRVNFYRVSLAPPADFVAVYRELLSPAECDRADRFVTDELTRRFVVCRGVLRRILAAALSISPAEIRFDVGPHGKPALAADHCSEVQFNVSHTGDVAAIAVSSGRALGVDIEAIDRRVSRDELAARFFSARERETYFALPVDRRQAAFYRIWTCKEAYLKAIGAGLSFPLGKFSVSVAVDEPPGLLSVDGAPEEVSRWRFVAPEVGENCVAALAVEGSGWTLANRDWIHCVGAGSS